MSEKPKIRPVVANALRLLVGACPTFEVTPATGLAWELALRDYTDADILKGVELLIRTHDYGAPAPAHLCGCIEGRVTYRQIPIKDGYGATLLKFPGGPPLTKQVPYRVWADGREIEVDPETLRVPENDPRALPPGQRSTKRLNRPASLGDDVRGLIP